MFRTGGLPVTPYQLRKIMEGLPRVGSPDNNVVEACTQL